MAPKKSSKKNQIKRITRAPKSITKTRIEAPQKSRWSMSIFIYWFIVLFFVSATFYIMGRSHHIINGDTNAPIEETLMGANAYFDSGREMLVAGNIADAISNLTLAIESDENFVDAYILRGEANMQIGEYENAQNDFTRAIELSSDNGVAYFDRALLFTRVENYDAAMNDINSALAAQIANPNTLLTLRDIYAKRGQLNLWLKNWEGAVADYTASLTHAEGIVNPYVYSERAEAYTALGSFDSAIADYTTAIRVISEQIQGLTEQSAKDELARRSMTFYEKSAALNLNIGNIPGAQSDLESARTIATALDDMETAERIRDLIMSL